MISPVFDSVAREQGSVLAVDRRDALEAWLTVPDHYPDAVVTHEVLELVCSGRERPLPPRGARTGQRDQPRRKGRR